MYLVLLPRDRFGGAKGIVLRKVLRSGNNGQ